MKKLIRVNAQDVESGVLRAYIVTKEEVVRKPSRRVRKMLSRKKRLASLARAVFTGIKGAYICSVVLAMTTAANLLDAHSTLDIGRLVACLIWVAVPVSIYITHTFKER